ncbi:uncharacterized protein LOC121374867 [Gigantopelta aegis]|uniref:uncharacterized protein LOC121374867 n=1 Tax=Gigantopelta aegis TaxID=1735272 RepID=UPI001B8882E3|nr:uncharacterized protein LOC121374867 [Gigantopelta aegis]
MLPLNCKIVSWCFLVLLLLDIGCQVTAVEYTFKHRYSYKKKRDDKRYKNAKQRCDMSGQCQGIYGIELTRCLRQCMSKRCYNELYADDKLEEGEIDVRLNSFKGCLYQNPTGD